MTKKPQQFSPELITKIYKEWILPEIKRLTK